MDSIVSESLQTDCVKVAVRGTILIIPYNNSKATYCKREGVFGDFHIM